MKTSLIMSAMVIGFALFMLTNNIVLAEEVTQPTLKIVGESSTLDSETIADIDDGLNESVSGMKIGWQRLGLLLTFNKEKKAEKELNLARLELIRAKNAAMNNNNKGVEKALENHERYLERVRSRLNEIDEKSTKDSLNNSAKGLISMEKSIEIHEARIAKLNEILSSSNLTEEQIEILQMRLEKAENVTAHLKEVQSEKRERIKTKIMAINNLTDNQAEEEIKKIEKSAKLQEVRQKVAEVKRNSAQKSIQKIRERIQMRLEDGKNITNAQERIQHFEDKVGSIEKKYETTTQNRIQKGK